MRRNLRIHLLDRWQPGGAAASTGAAGWLSHHTDVASKHRAGPHCLLPLGSLLERTGYGYHGGRHGPRYDDGYATVGAAAGAAFLLEDGV